MIFQLVCLDPGFASIGYARLVLVGSLVPRCVEFGVLHTVKSDKKKNVFAVEDNVRRTMEISKRMRELCSAPDGRTIGLCCEAMSFPRNASVAAKMALAWGAIASLSEAAAVPILQAGPKEIKHAVTGCKTATKEEVQAAVVKLYPEIREMRATIKADDWEHCHDALAVGHMMLSSDLIRMARLTQGGNAA